jgi:YNFM family putative membrane transporter
VLAAEFGVDAAGSSLSVSAVVLGIALATLPFGGLVDRYPMRPLVLVGGVMVGLAGLVCALTRDFALLVAARFAQGLFLPALTTCLAAYLANRLPAERLNVVMGAYVSATVVGGLGGRLLGGWIHPPLHWRYAFVSATVLVLAAAVAAARWLPGAGVAPPRHDSALGYRQLLTSWPVLRMYAVVFGAFWVFSVTFNYLPFYLSAPPFEASTGLITLIYGVYLIGAAIGPLAGRLANRVGSGATLLLGTAVFTVALTLTLIPSMLAVVAGLMLVCAGFFATHAAAAGALNRRLSGSRGRGNALYVLFYYAGGTAGITASGLAFRHGGWPAVVGSGVLVLGLPLAVGLLEARESHRSSVPGGGEEGPASGA